MHIGAPEGSRKGVSKAQAYATRRFIYKLPSLNVKIHYPVVKSEGPALLLQEEADEFSIVELSWCRQESQQQENAISCPIHCLNPNQGVQEGKATKPLYLKSWKDICKPIRQGGLGVRDLQAVNNALLTASSWRIVQYQDEQVNRNTQDGVIQQQFPPNWQRMIQGKNVYIDASWKNACTNNSTHVGTKITTGIGIFIATRSVTISALQAEVQGLLLATSITQALHLQDPNYLMDNQTVVAAAQKRGINQASIHWHIKAQLATSLAGLQEQIPEVYKIKREFNKFAHKEAQDAIKQVVTT